MIVQFNFIFQFGPAELSDIRIFQIQLLCLMRKIEDKKEKKTVCINSLWNFVEQQDKYFSKNQFSRRDDGNKPKC